MTILLYLLSLLMLVSGAAMLFSPDSFKKLCEKVSKIENTKLLSIPAFVFAFVLIVSAGRTSFPMFAQVLGAIALIKGLALVFVSKEKMADVFSWVLNTPVLAFRLLGVLNGGLGLILYKIIL